MAGHRVLIATDGSELALDAARRASAFLSTDNTYVVLSVIAGSGVPTGLDAGFPAPVPDPALTAELARAAEADAHLAAGAVAQLFEPAARIRISRGEPGRTICEVAKDEGADLIIVGSHGAGVIRRVLLGSVSHHVLHHSTCPVLVVRAPADD